MTLLTNLRKKRINLQLRYRLKIFMKKKIYINQINKRTHLFTQIGNYIPTKAFGKTIHDSERNRKRKAKKKNKKIEKADRKYFCRYNRYILRSKKVFQQLHHRFVINVFLQFVRYSLLHYVNYIIRKFNKTMKFGMVGIKVLTYKIKTYNKFKVRRRTSAYIFFFIIIQMLPALQALKNKIMPVKLKSSLALTTTRNHTTTTPWQAGRAKGDTGHKQMKKLAKTLNISQEEAAMLFKKKVYHPTFDLLMHSKDLSDQQHASEAKEYDEDHLLISHTYTSSSVVKQNPYEQGKTATYMGSVNLKGDDKDQFTLHSVTIIAKSDWKPYDQQKFYTGAEKLMLTENAKRIRNNYALDVEVVGTKGMASLKENDFGAYLKTKYAQNDKFKQLILTLDLYRVDARKYSQRLSYDNTSLIIVNNYKTTNNLYAWLKEDLPKKKKQEMEWFLKNKHIPIKNRLETVSAPCQRYSSSWEIQEDSKRIIDADFEILSTKTINPQKLAVKTVKSESQVEEEKLDKEISKLRMDYFKLQLQEYIKNFNDT